jgi:tRNA 2-thiouridine synthesizing protein A
VSDAPDAAAEWDAGDLGCGEVLVMLRSRMRGIGAGQVLKLTVRDLGAPEEMPAWCRMTERRLLRAEHPHYWIEQRQDP